MEDTADYWLLDFRSLFPAPRFSNRLKVSCITSVMVIDLIGQLPHDVIGRLSVMP